MPVDMTLSYTTRSAPLTLIHLTVWNRGGAYENRGCIPITLSGRRGRGAEHRGGRDAVPRGEFVQSHAGTGRGDRPPAGRRHERREREAHGAAAHRSGPEGDAGRGMADRHLSPEHRI